MKNVKKIKSIIVLVLIISMFLGITLSVNATSEYHL